MEDIGDGTPQFKRLRGAPQARAAAVGPAASVGFTAVSDHRPAPEAPHHHQPDRSGGVVWLELSVLSLMWGSAFLLMKVAVPTVPPFVMAAARGLLAAALLWGVIRVSRRTPAKPCRSWKPALVLGTVSGWLPNVLTAWALLRLDSSVAGMLAASGPIFVVVLAHVFLASERLRRSQTIGVVVGFVGVGLIIGVTPSSFGRADLVGQLVLVGVSLSYAIGTVYARTIGPQDATGLAMRQQLVAGVVALVVALGIEQPWTVRPEPIAVAAVLALAVWASAIPIWIYFRMLGHTRAVIVSLVAYLIPVVAVVLGFVVLDEPLEATSVAGLVVVFAGIFITTRPARTTAAPQVSAAGIRPEDTEPSA
jgi:drug/metabolite transporter (DMT)-like permease